MHALQVRTEGLRAKDKLLEGVDSSGWYSSNHIALKSVFFLVASIAVTWGDVQFVLKPEICLPTLKSVNLHPYPGLPGFGMEFSTHVSYGRECRFRMPYQGGFCPPGYSPTGRGRGELFLHSVAGGWVGGGVRALNRSLDSLSVSSLSGRGRGGRGLHWGAKWMSGQGSAGVGGRWKSFFLQ